MIISAVVSVALKTYAQGYDLFSAHMANWVGEGSGIEMQHLLIGGPIRFCEGVGNFSDNGTLPSEMWAQEVARKINHSEQDLINADAIMQGFTGMVSYSLDRQLWSFFMFIKDRCGVKSGPSNKFMNIIKAIAQGTSSQEAISTILNLKEPVLTAEWQTWAANQR